MGGAADPNRPPRTELCKISGGLGIQIPSFLRRQESRRSRGCEPSQRSDGLPKRHSRAVECPKREQRAAIRLDSCLRRNDGWGAAGGRRLLRRSVRRGSCRPIRNAPYARTVRRSKTPPYVSRLRAYACDRDVEAACETGGASHAQSRRRFRWLTLLESGCGCATRGSRRCGRCSIYVGISFRTGTEARRWHRLSGVRLEPDDPRNEGGSAEHPLHGNFDELVELIERMPEVGRP